MYLIIIIFSVLLLLYLMYNPIESFSSTRICNDIDKRCYEVADSFENKNYASELLASLNKFCLKFMIHLRNKYLWNPQKNYDPHCREIVEFLIYNYNPDGIIENAPIDDTNTSYVDEKGKVFAICLREKITGKNDFQKLEDIYFVLIHEMTHMGTKTYRHEKEFWVHFKFLLKEAEEAGLYKPVDYKKFPMNYCGLNVNYNPYFDNSLLDLYSV